MTKSRTKALTVAAAISCPLITTAHAAFTISNARTRNVSCASGVCTPTGGNANLNTGDLQTMLASSDVTVKSSASAPVLSVLDPLTWASTHNLTLDAYQSIHVRAPIVVEGTAGIVLVTNDGGSGGDYNFNAATSGAITFWDTGSSLVINGASYTLLNDIHALASDIAASPSSNYALAKNYDATADGTYAHAPVGAYAGSFEGLGNTIDNLTILSTSCGARVGLFNTLNVGAAIRDINLPNASVRDAASECVETVGALVGFSSGTIAGANVAGAVSSASGRVGIGGLAGHVNVGTVIASHFTGTVSGHGKDSQGTVGGLIGYLGGTVLQSSAHADVENGRFVGGLVGSLYGTIDLSSATGTVKGHVAGGLAGVAFSSTISRSFATAQVFAPEGGGLVGAMSVGGSSYFFLDYATGAVTGAGSPNSAYRAGFIGEADITANFLAVYATGYVPSKQNLCAAGFVGYSGGTYQSAYWDTTTTKQGQSSCNGAQGIVGLTDAQLKASLPAGFDPTVWGQNVNINNGWPYLLANPPQ